DSSCHRRGNRIFPVTLPARWHNRVPHFPPGGTRSRWKDSRMKRLVAVGLGLVLSAILTGCCCTPCCSSPCGPCGYGGCGPAGCPAPVGVPAGAYYAPPCNGSCGAY